MRFSVEAIGVLSLSSSAVAGFGFSSSALTGGVTARVRVSSRLHISGRGWENDDFLNSLGGDQQDRDNANDKYFKKKEDVQRFRDRQAVSAFGSIRYAILYYTILSYHYNAICIINWCLCLYSPL